MNKKKRKNEEISLAVSRLGPGEDMRMARPSHWRWRMASHRGAPRASPERSSGR